MTKWTNNGKQLGICDKPPKNHDHPLARKGVRVNIGLANETDRLEKCQDELVILIEAAITISNALHNEKMRGAKFKASTDTAWEKLSLAIERARAFQYTP